MNEKSKNKLEKEKKIETIKELEPETKIEEQKEIFTEIKSLILRFYVKADVEQIESLEKVMKSGKKIAEGRRELDNITFPEPNVQKKVELVIKSIEVNLDQAENSQGYEIDEKRKKVMKKETEVEIEKIEISNQSIIPEIVKNIRKNPLITKTQAENVIFGEPMSRHPKMAFLISFIVDDIILTLWGECKSCSNSGVKCNKCKKRGGVRAIMTGYTFVPKPIEFTVWGSHLLGLFGLEKSDFVTLVKLHGDHARKEFLKLYRARLFLAQSKYTEYNGQLKISTNKLNCVNWNSLLIGSQI